MEQQKADKRAAGEIEEGGWGLLDCAVEDYKHSTNKTVTQRGDAKHEQAASVSD